MDAHLGGERDAENRRNGHNRKRMLTDDSALDLEVPRDRAGRFEPQLVERYARRLPGFDDKVISMYARGMTTRDIRGHVAEIYGVTVSAELISKVTDAVLEGGCGVAVAAAGGGLRDRLLRCGTGEDLFLRNRSGMRAWCATRPSIWRFGVTRAGRKEVLGLWIEQTEGAKFC